MERLVRGFEATHVFGWVIVGLMLASIATGVTALLMRGHPWTRREGGLAVTSLLLALAVPVCGFVGTVAGLLTAFGAVGHASPSEKQAMLSNGISEAMNNTALGLVLTVPATIVSIFAIVSSARRRSRR